MAGLPKAGHAEEEQEGEQGQDIEEALRESTHRRIVPYVDNVP